MSERTPCGNCGGLNKLSAAFCGQCFTTLAGAVPAAAGAGAGWSGSAGPSIRFGAESTATASVTRARSESFFARAIALALVVVAGIAGWFLISQKSDSVTSDDGSFTLSHSSYWEPVDKTEIPVITGIAPDVVLAHGEDAVIIAVDLPIPPDASPAQMSRMSRAELQAMLDSQPYGIKLQHFASPGRSKIAGRRAFLEAKATFDFAGLSGRVELVAARHDKGGVPNLLMVEMTCVAADCSEASREFKSILKRATLN